MKKLDLVGLKFCLLTVVSRSEKEGRTRWNCVCECGNKSVVQTSHLTSLYTQSCGCIHGKVKEYHGGSNTAEYTVWRAMLARCLNENNDHYANYGGRGIVICEEWIASFGSFIKDMGSRPSESHTIEREDTNGNYEKSNCRWATRKENQQNMRISKFWFVDGVRYDSISHASDELLVSTSTIERWCNGGKNNGKQVNKKPGCYSELKYKEKS